MPRSVTASARCGGSHSVRPRAGRARALSLGIVACVLLSPGVGAQNDPNACDVTGEYPDVIVGDIDQVVRWGTLHNRTAFSFSTVSCNIGTCWLNWIQPTSDHPVIGQNLYRLKDGRLEQIGQSWLKHGFFALAGELCRTGCVQGDGQHLGVNCSDPYSAFLNGDQSTLGPKSEVNPATGAFPFPPSQAGVTGDVLYKRLQIHDVDLDPSLNPGALYFVEAQYVAADDAAVGRNDNNASHRRVTVSGSNGMYALALADHVVREEPALLAWADADPTVLVQVIDVPADGRLLVASRAAPAGNGYWRYEYAVQNLNSYRAVGSYRVPVPYGADVEVIRFHDVAYHSGEPFDGTDWPGSVVQDETGWYVEWATTPFDENPDANALRWGTTYNFRFLANVAPGAQARPVELGLFRERMSGMVTAAMIVPDGCDEDGVCEPGETCASCAADCLGSGMDPTCCGDGICDGSELPCTCAADCGPCIVECDDDTQCDDGVFCNGVEHCDGGMCVAGDAPCPGQPCDEATQACIECLTDDGCNDGDWCNGQETCVGHVCQPGTAACPGRQCREDLDYCVDCLVDAHCDDGLFCNGVEACQDEKCVAGTSPCAPTEYCDEQTRFCIGCEVECDDGQFCNGEEVCIGELCAPGVPPCTDTFCDEDDNYCVPTPPLQRAPGSPLTGLTADQLQRFALGHEAFQHRVTFEEGLGPAYNAAGCRDCHSAVDGSGDATVTRFGRDDGGTFDPLTSQGGSLLQSLALAPECLETVPPEANVTGERVPTTLLGAGLVEAVSDATLAVRDLPGGPVISGRAQRVAPLEDPSATRIGRFGWKSDQATLLSVAAHEARGHLGLTSQWLPDEDPPNGNVELLATCDTVPDPEDPGGGPNASFVERVADYARLLAPPPQTPASGMTGESSFFGNGCGGCHVAQMTTGNDSSIEPELRRRVLHAYSDFLLHDMGAAGDPLGQGAGEPGEVRTAPLWGLRGRSRLWHDGRIQGGTFEERAWAAIELHNSPGSEARTAALSLKAQSTIVREATLRFLGSLGRVEFDADADGDVDRADFDALYACFTGPGEFYTLEHPCAVFDVDRDGDVDTTDYTGFLVAFSGAFGGCVPDGATVPGTPLTLDKAPGGMLTASWGASCQPDDDDYALYQGTLGNFVSHRAVVCSTEGARTLTFEPGPGSTYYLVVPTNGLSEGSYGVDGAGQARPRGPSGGACLPRRASGCPG